MNEMNGECEALIDRLERSANWLIAGDVKPGPHVSPQDLRQAADLLRAALASRPAEPAGGKFGCVGDDGLFHIHDENKTCDVCASRFWLSDEARDAALRLTHATDPTDYFGCEDDIRLLANSVLAAAGSPE